MKYYRVTMNNDDWFNLYAQTREKEPIRSGLYNIKWPDNTITLEKVSIEEERLHGGGGHGDPIYTYYKRAYISVVMNGLTLKIDLSQSDLEIGRR